jgi:hypothetical protein
MTALQRSLLAGFFATCVVAAMSGGCRAEVDLGSNLAPLGHDGGPDSPTPIDLSQHVEKDCPVVSETEAEALRGTTCESTCGDPWGDTRLMTSAKELVAVTRGSWRLCAGVSPWPADVVGIELQAGCTVFLLHDADGGVSRSIDPAEQGTFDVIESRIGTLHGYVIDIHVPSGNLRAHVTVSDCPNRLLLTPDGAVPLDFSVALGGPSPA